MSQACVTRRLGAGRLQRSLRGSILARDPPLPGVELVRAQTLTLRAKFIPPILHPTSARTALVGDPGFAGRLPAVRNGSVHGGACSRDLRVRMKTLPPLTRLLVGPALTTGSRPQLTQMSPPARLSSRNAVHPWWHLGALRFEAATRTRWDETCALSLPAASPGVYSQGFAYPSGRFLCRTQPTPMRGFSASGVS